MGAKNQVGQRVLAGTRPPPQVCRQILYVCVKCGYKIRTSRSWAEVGLPTCSCGGSFRDGYPINKIGSIGKGGGRRG